MQNKVLPVTLSILFLINLSLIAQYHNVQDTKYSNFFVGSSFFVLGNFDTQNSPEFAQINLGYRITGRDVLSLEVKTWKYEWSLGIPWPSFEAPDEKFPGYIREYGFAIAYQRFWWKGVYTAIHVMNAKQDFVDLDGVKIDDGYQIFNTYRLGYHFKLFSDKFFIEPSIAITHRPFHTEMPASFKRLDDKRPNYFLGEPGMHFGFNF